MRIDRNREREMRDVVRYSEAVKVRLVEEVAAGKEP
jgi:hypothetical protein